MINLARGVNIASYWSLSPQTFSLFSNNCKIIGKFLQKRAEERGGGVGSLLELAPEFDFQKLVLITKWCDIPIHSLIMNQSINSEKDIDSSKSNTATTRYLIQKSACKEIFIKVAIGKVACHIIVNYFMECCKSCEKISFQFFAKRGASLITCYVFEYSKTSPLIVERIRLRCVRSDDDLKEIVKLEMLDSVKRLELQYCITNAFNGFEFKNLEYLKVENTTSPTINHWKMPKLQTYICNGSAPCQNLQHAENLQELIVDHQRILNFKVVKIDNNLDYLEF